MCGNQNLKHGAGFLILVLVFFVPQKVFSQDDQDDAHAITISIPEVSLVAVRGPSGNSISLNPETPLEAGAFLPKEVASDSSLWLNYSNVKSESTHPSRKVYVKISSGTVPPGFVLKVKAGQPAGDQADHLGQSTGAVTLSNSDEAIVSSIATTYTGTGTGNGHQLTYTLETIPGQTHLIDMNTSGTIQVTYTIAD
ncbi:MAG: hypothetical protein GC181_04690 [Bacteroidetes bacterium]|nr:hypothetical protein [Bacteroidota bacterium]